MTPAQSQHRFAVIIAFALVYFFWGSTYLGIDIAVEHIPPALMCGIRFTIAGAFMLAFCGLRGRKIRYRPSQLAQMAVVGVLLLVGGNLTLSYAEKYVGSGLAALIIAVTPALVSGAGLAAARRSPHRRAGKNRTGPGRCRATGAIVA